MASKNLSSESDRAGFDCEFVNDRPLWAVCSICSLILRYPRQGLCCGEIFCKSCIERVEVNGKECPACQVVGFTTFEDKSLKQTLSNFRVYCEKKKEGCKWEGELGNELEKHLNESPPPERQLEGCQFVEVKCLYCPHTHRRSSISAHQKNCCQRPYECKYCGYKDTYEKVTQNHQKILCPAFPMPCSIGCELIVKRSEMEQHVSKECGLRMVKCEFHDVGCSVEMPAKDLQAHMNEELTRHSSLVAQFASDTKNELSRLQQKNEQLEVDKAAKSTTTSLKSRLCSLEDENKELKCTIKSLEDKNKKSKEQTNLLFLLTVVIVLAAVCLAPTPIGDNERIEKLEKRIENDTHDIKVEMKGITERVEEVEKRIESDTHGDEVEIQVITERVGELEKRIENDTHDIQEITERVEKLDTHGVKVEIKGITERVEKLEESDTRGDKVGITERVEKLEERIERDTQGDKAEIQEITKRVEALEKNEKQIRAIKGSGERSCKGKMVLIIVCIIWIMYV